MKHRLIPLVFGAALALGTLATAQADPFYFDLGTDYGTAGTQAAGSNTTGLFNEMLFKYDSTTTFDDTDGDGLYSVGDTSTGTGGVLNQPQFGIGSNLFSENAITSFTPILGPSGGPSRNGFSDDWFLTFGWDDLVAEVNSFGGLTYTSGTIEFYYAEPGSGLTNFMNLEVVGGGNNAIGQSLNLEARVDFGTLTGSNGVTSTGVDVDEFILREDGTSFYDYVVGGGNEIVSIVDQNTEPFWLNGEENDSPELGVTTYDNGLVLSGRHDGSLVFVPEPSVIVLFGSGLVVLGLAFGFRRRSGQDLVA